MIAFVIRLVTTLGRRTMMWAALTVAFLAALWIAAREGRQAGEARFVIRRANARLRALQTAKDIHHDVQNADRADLERRADRWMRD